MPPELRTHKPMQLPSLSTRLVKAVLLETWQPVAAMAAHAALPNKTVLAVLQREEGNWGLESRKCRLDGSNSVHFYRIRPKPQQMQVMGVWVNAPIDEVEA